MPNSLFDRFWITEANLNFRNQLPNISSDVQQTLSRILVWDESNKEFLFLRSDTDGRLQVTGSASTSDQANNSSVTVNNVSTTIAAANPDRKSILIQNLGTQEVYFELASVALVAIGIELKTNQIFETSIYTGAISGITSAGSSDVRVVEIS